MTDWNSAICETNGINIHYTRTGGNKPPLILLHGLMTNGLCWTDLAYALEKEYDVIMPDARGHGKSSVPDYGYRYEDHANDVTGLINVLRLPPAVLIGHSMGGMTAAVVAGRKPNLVRSLILADPTFLSPKVQREVYDSDVADQHLRILKMSLDEVVAEARIRHPDRSSETLELFALARLQTSMNAFDVLIPPNPDYTHLISKIDVPSLLVFGDKGVVSAAVAKELQLINPELQVEQIPEAGHGVHLDQPEQFTAIVKSFLRSTFIQKNTTKMKTNSSENKPKESVQSPFSQTFFHGTKADLKIGDFIEIGINSNYGQKNKAKYIYLTATLDAAIWGAELALGKGRERIYLVEPTGSIEDDPNLTDKKFPGNPTKSYRSKHPFKVVGEITIWQGHAPELLKTMKDNLERLKQLGIEAIED